MIEIEKFQYKVVKFNFCHDTHKFVERKYFWGISKILLFFCCIKLFIFWGLFQIFSSNNVAIPTHGMIN